MRRQLAQLADWTFDVVVVGGGIYGACVAWDASQRGLSVALIEKEDFGGATSANSLKIIHGGLRYLQQADFQRMRESILERRALLRIAPHLVQPLPVLIPTYGHVRGPALFRLALAVNDLVSADRNWLADPHQHIPAGRVVPRDEALCLAPGIASDGLTGGAVFADAQVYNSERLVLAFIQSASQVGAVVANYVEALDLIQQGQRVTGVHARDTFSGDEFAIQGRAVINTAGPWVNRVRSFRRAAPKAPIPFAKAVNLVSRPLFRTHAVGLVVRSDPTASEAEQMGSRLMFVAPWRGYSLVGTTYVVYDQDPKSLRITERDIERCLKAINAAYPAGELRREDVSYAHGGLVPRAPGAATNGTVPLARHYQIIDEAQFGLPGLFSVVGIKYTTARNVAERAIDHVFRAWGQIPPPSHTAVTPLVGGEIARWLSFVAHLPAAQSDVDLQTWLSFARNYGTLFPKVLDTLNGQPLTSASLIEAQVRYAVREEMACTLDDVIRRRTELGSAGRPGDETLRLAGDVMRAELGWGEDHAARERQAVESVYDYSATEVQ